MKTKNSKIASKRATAFILAFLMLMLTVTSFNHSLFVQGITNAIFANADDIRIIEITESRKLDENMDADIVYIKSGTLDLNGKTLTVTGNVYVYSGAYLYMNGGQLSVNGDFALASETGDNGGYLLMENSEEILSVIGDFTASSYRNYNSITDGNIYIGGNFTRNNNNYYGS